MSSIVTAVFKATIGLLVSKGRDKAAEKLKEGDVTDKKIRELIVREINNIKEKLDGLSRQYLLTAIDAFEAGLRYLYEAIDARRSGKGSAATAEVTGSMKEENLKEFSSPSPTDAVKTVTLAAGIRNMELTELDERTKRALSQAKKRFELAREKATEAFNNEALSTFDRITAIRYRVVATMLESAVETVGTARDLSSLSVTSALENALPECEQCLQKLHSLPDVQKNFKVELDKGLLNIKGQIGKVERREIISTVFQINGAIFDAMHTAGKDVLFWPSVDIGEDKVDPLHDLRVAKVLRKVGMEHYCVTPWSFGQEGEEEEHKLKDPRGIATNADGQFIVGDNGDNTVKVFSSSGNFLLSFKPQTVDANTKLEILDVATDVNSNTYVLVVLERPGTKVYEMEVQLYNSTADLQRKFPVRGRLGCLTVSKNKVLVLTMIRHWCTQVDVHEHDGRFVCSVGDGLLENAWGITAANEDRMIILDRDFSHVHVHVFTEEGKHLSEFNIHIEGEMYIRYYRIAVHPAGEHVVVAGEVPGTDFVAVFTLDGEFVRRIQPGEEKIGRCVGLTVTMDGRIAVAAAVPGNSKVLVI